MIMILTQILIMVTVPVMVSAPLFRALHQRVVCFFTATHSHDASTYGHPQA